jgi:hypothetical protein
MDSGKHVSFRRFKCGDRVTSAVKCWADELTHAGIKDDLTLAAALAVAVRERAAHRLVACAYVKYTRDEQRG